MFSKSGPIGALIHPSIHPPTQCLLSTYNVPVTALRCWRCRTISFDQGLHPNLNYHHKNGAHRALEEYKMMTSPSSYFRANPGVPHTLPFMVSKTSFPLDTDFRKLHSYLKIHLGRTDFLKILGFPIKIKRWLSINIALL